ncbi:SpoIIE family protein phosphatase [Streptomyces chiangmaiensis]
MAATCLYAVYDPVTRYCSMARAGHPRSRSSTRTATSPSPTCPPEHRSASNWSPSSP